MFRLVLRASASPAEELKLVQTPLYTVVAGIATSDDGIFQLTFLLSFLLFKPFPYIPI